MQCFNLYNQYQKKYREVMFESALGISKYVGDILNEMNENGVPYNKMNGLTEFLSEKLEALPLLWSINVVNVYADTNDSMQRKSEFGISIPIGNSEKSTNMRINVEISKKYISEKMRDMLLIFAATFAIALIMIHELLKLPDNLFARFSEKFKKSEVLQVQSVPATLRIGAFIAYTGSYIAMPFSAILIRQWDLPLFGIPVAFLSSVPITAELLAVMLCSMLFIPIYKRIGLKTVFNASTMLSVCASLLCIFASNSIELIFLRFMSGIGFAGIKYTFNSIISHGALQQTDITNNLAFLNAGLLGGITCGASLGAVIASAVNIQTSYFIAGIFYLLQCFWSCCFHRGKCLLQMP